MINQGIYNNLVSQFHRVEKHNRQGSIKTKHRYIEAMLRFLVFVAVMFRLEKIANIAPKHIYAYVAYLIENGRAIAYIKTELSAIRFWHDQIPGAKHQLPSNADLNLGRRQYGGADRTWSGREFNMALMIAVQMGLELYVALLCLARYAGLRLHECFRLNTRDAELALVTGKLTVKGKGGLIREVPINLTIEIELKKLLAITPRGHKLFVAADDKTHLAMNRLEVFLCAHKAEIQDADSTRPLTFHGLRHTYAVEEYKKCIAQGMGEKEARLAVAKLLGHGRDNVTKVYLASLADTAEGKGGDADGR